jgi:hypothetical protein
MLVRASNGANGMAKRQTGKDDVKAPVSTALDEAELDSVTGGTGSSQGGSGSGAGKATFHDISINKEADKSAPTLF